MKIVCISDTHGQHRDLVLPQGDILIHAGDLTVRGTAEQLNDYFSWMSGLNFSHKIVVAGNHDFGLESKNPEVVLPKNIIYLENGLVEVAGLTIWGSPVSTPFFDWAFMWELDRREALYNTIPNNVDIIINHGPPFGILDWTNRGTNAGCEALRNRIQIVKPKLCVFGHIHEDYGVMTIDGTTYVNASILNKKYVIANQPIIVEI